MDAMCWSPTRYKSMYFVDDVMYYMCGIDYNIVCSAGKNAMVRWEYTALVPTA